MQMAYLSSAHTSFALPKPRRQFQSCDNCRNRRRKCDAGALGIDPYSARGTLNHRACTACARFGRACTFTWLSQRKRPRAFIEAQNAKGHCLPRKKRTALAPQDQSVDFPLADASSTVSTTDAVSNQNSFDSHSSFDKGSSQQQEQHVISIPTTSDARDGSWAFTPVDMGALLEQPEFDIYSSEFYCDAIQEPTQTSSLDENDTEFVMEGSTNHTVPSLTLPNLTACSMPACPPPTAFNLAEERLLIRENRGSVTEILISIYRANLEGVLSSWSTAITCPYTSYSSELAASTGYSCSSFYDRAKRMDESLPRLGLERVVGSANSHRGMESQVLNKVILAFASQWDNASAQRQHIGDDTFAQTLQAVMHRTLWHDAHTALQKVAGPAGSFRIILARLIFSFMHSPLDSEPSADDVGSRTYYDRHPSGWDGGVREDVCASIVSDPGCAAQMEMALRDLLHWRRQLHVRLRATVEAGNPLSIDQQSFLNDFNTIFWLSVMCDTTASAISGRPLVISDEDCAIEHLYPESPLTPISCGGDRSSRSEFVAPGDSWKMCTPLWKSVLIKEIDDSPHLSPACDSISPEATIKRAIPLKVLLFRHIGTLQVLIDRRAAGYRIENAIQDGLLVYRQWQIKYGNFMDGCVDKYASMSHLLRSWHTILVAHWHYGVMLFAEKVQIVDRLQLRQNSRHRERLAHYTPAGLAMSSAMQVARLARCCLETSRAASLSPGQIHSRLAMLSEPWCEIMVRSLAMSTENLLKSYVSGAGHHDKQPIQALREGMNACIEVLEELGACRYRTASRIAQILRRELDCVSQGG